MPHLSLKRVSTPGQTGLLSLSFDVRDGECLALFGRGKSGVLPALTAIAGLTPISEGEILLDGRRIDRLPPARRRVGMIFHDFALYPHMSVRENLLFALRARKLAPDLVKSRFERVFAILPLEPIEDRKPHALTPLEQACTALARVLMEEPDIILIQRLSGLRAEEKAQFFRLLAGARGIFRSPIVYAAETAREVFFAADRVAFLSARRLVQIGKPEEIYFRPIDSNVARAFTGCEPVFLEASIQARIEDGEPRYAVILSPAYTLPIAPGVETKLIDGQRVSLCLRPEHVRLAFSPDGSCGVMRGELVDVRRELPDSLVTVALESGARLRLRCSLREGMALTRENPVYFTIDSSLLLIFDAQTGDALY